METKEPAKPQPFKALLLDERDVLRAVVDIADEAELTARHVDLRPHGNACDRKPGEYRWDRKAKALMPLAKVLRAQEGRPTFEQAYAFDLLDRWKSAPLSVPDVALAWLDDMVRSFDFAGLKQVPIVAEYRAARGLNENKGA